jgi:hypothetical protein
VTDPNETPDPVEAAPEPLDQTTPPVDENFAIDLSSDEAGEAE